MRESVLRGGGCGPTLSACIVGGVPGVTSLPPLSEPFQSEGLSGGVALLSVGQLASLAEEQRGGVSRGEGGKKDTLSPLTRSGEPGPLSLGRPLDCGSAGSAVSD